jgi:hypothetical protein
VLEHLQALRADLAAMKADLASMKTEQRTQTRTLNVLWWPTSWARTTASANWHDDPEQGMMRTN